MHFSDADEKHGAHFFIQKLGYIGAETIQLFFEVLPFFLR